MNSMLEEKDINFKEIEIEETDGVWLNLQEKDHTSRKAFGKNPCQEVFRKTL